MYFRSLKTLVLMQLKDKLDLKFLHSTKHLIAKIVLSILSFILVTAGLYLLFYVARFLKVFSLASIIPVSVVAVMFTVMLLLSVVTCTLGLMKNMYFAKDNQILLTLPVTSNQIFISKLIVFYIYQLMRDIYFILPLFLAYDMINGLPVGFYLWLPFCILLIAAIPVAVGALLSILAFGVTIVLNKLSLLRWALFITAVGLGIYAVVYVIALIPANLDIIGSWGTLFWQIQDFLKTFVKTFEPFLWITNMVVGTFHGLVPVLFTARTWLTVLQIIVFVAVMIALSFLIIRPLFFKMASSPFEHKKQLTHAKHNRKPIPPFFSSVRKEWFMIFRTSDEAYSLFGVAIALPILILLLNKIFAAMSTRLLGDYMAVSFNLLIITLIAMASNNRLASIFSREGSAAYHIKTRPNRYHGNLLAKMVIYLVVMVLSIGSAVVVFARFNTLSTFNIVMLGLAAVAIYVAHAFWSAEMDIMHPQSQAYQTAGVAHNNPNELKSTIAMVALSLLFFGISLFLAIEDIGVAWGKVFGVALVLMLYRIWSFCSKVKYYYLEKQS